MKYYAEEDNEHVYPLSYFEEGIEAGEGPFTLHVMKREPGGEMWCNKYREFGRECGKNCCEEYSPCNGKNGRCRFLVNGFTTTGKRIELSNRGVKKL